METTHIASEIPSFTPTSTSVVSIPDITLPAEITTLDDTSQMGTETSTFLLSSRNNSEMTRPTTVAMSPTLEVSTLESPTTPLATPVTQPVSEDTATTIFATTLNANSVQVCLSFLLCRMILSAFMLFSYTCNSSSSQMNSACNLLHDKIMICQVCNWIYFFIFFIV